MTSSQTIGRLVVSERSKNQKKLTALNRTTSVGRSIEEIRRILDGSIDQNCREPIAGTGLQAASIADGSS
jgi:hypothetical protein